MRKSREFNNVLDECLERLLVKGETIEQCLQSFPKHVDELKPLLEMTLITKQVSSIQPRSEFRDKARHQFYSALQEMERKKSRAFFSWGWQPRWATVVAIVLALFLVGGGSTVAAASDSMPDDLLYPVKLATEQVQLAFTFSTLGKAELHAKLADKRVMEIVYLADKSEPEKIELVANSLNNNLTEISMLVSAEKVMGGVAMVPAAEKAVVAEEAEAVEEAPAAREVPVLEEVLAPEEETAVEEAPMLTERGGGTQELVKVDRRASLRETVALQANNNATLLRDLLETVPESVKPALLRAIALLEAGYENALESLE